MSLSILEPALVDLTIYSDIEAFAVRGLSTCEDLADVLLISLPVWDDEPHEVFRLDELRSLTVVKVALFVSNLSCFIAIKLFDRVLGVFE